MYTILLADDEKLELDSLRNHINWSSMGIRVIGNAKNGKEALKIVDEFHPDIVITDVKMPVMDGLEFARNARNIDKNLKIVFLSGYDDFKFVKAAMMVDAIDYLLKPVDINELSSLIDKIKSRFEKERLATQSIRVNIEKCIKGLILESNPSIRNQFIEKLGSMGADSQYYFSPSYSLFSVYVDDFTEYTLKNGEYSSELLCSNIYDYLTETIAYYLKNGIVINMKTGQYCVLVDNSQNNKQSLDFLYKYLSENIRSSFGISVTISVSEKTSDIFLLNTIYEDLDNIYDYKFYLGNGKILTSGDCRDNNFNNPDYKLPQIKDKLCSAIYSMDMSLARSVIGAFVNQIVRDKPSKQPVCKYIFDTANYIYENIVRNDSTLNSLYNIDDFYNHLVLYKDTLEALQKYAFSKLEFIIGHMIEKNKDNKQQIVNNVISIIESSYYKQLTVEDISKQVYLTPNYLRTVFKEKTGETILDYITKYRISKATSLLQDKSLKIHEISVMVGYENISYFCSLFSKYKGITPNEFRKKIL